jgi:hypothetical protein
MLMSWEMMKRRLREGVEFSASCVLARRERRALRLRHPS